MRNFSLGLSLAAALLLTSFGLVLAHSGRLPAPANVSTIFGDRGFSPGSPIMIRIFKRESELELWMQKDGHFQLYATYPICFWSGKLGPKEREGDRQAPEGFYTVAADQLRVVGRHPRSFDIGYPNAFDRALGRSGSYILVHGGCTSIGCFAMTDPVMEEVYQLGEQALHGGQDQIPLHIFPFRMTEANLAPLADSKWYGFWSNLKQGFDAFEASQLPPSISVCRSNYVINEASSLDLSPAISVASDGCSPDQSTIASNAVPQPLLIRHRIASSHAGSRNLRHPKSKLVTVRRPARTSSLVVYRRVH